MARWLKVKYHEGKSVELRWATRNGDDWERHELESEDTPRGMFEEALEDLTQDVVRVLELPERFLEKLVVTTVTLSYGTNDQMGVVLSGVIEVEAGKFAVNTPRIRDKSADLLGETETGPGWMDAEMSKRLRELLDQAHSYASGQRVTTGEPEEEEREEEAEPELTAVS